MLLTFIYVLRIFCLSVDFWFDSNILSNSQLILMDSSFTEQKIVFSCDPSKAFGPDGFLFLFY
jgi:hypothetical protein